MLLNTPITIIIINAHLTSQYRHDENKLLYYNASKYKFTN